MVKMVKIAKYYSLVRDLIQARRDLIQARRARDPETQLAICIDAGWTLFNILDF